MARPAVIGSLHGFDLSRVLALAGRGEPPEVLVIGVESEAIGWSLELSPAVEGSMATALTAVREQLMDT